MLLTALAVLLTALAVLLTGCVIDWPGRVIDWPGRIIDWPGRIIDCSGRIIDWPGRVIDCSGSDLRRAIALARHRAPKCCTRRVIFSAPWSTHKQTRSKESDFSLSYSSLCPPKESDLSLSCHFQNLSTVTGLDMF